MVDPSDTTLDEDSWALWKKSKPSDPSDLEFITHKRNHPSLCFAPIVLFDDYPLPDSEEGLQIRE
jgi:hypothetical protein